MSASLMAERDKLQEEVEEMERALCVTSAEVDLLSSDSDDSDDEVEEVGEVQSAAGLLAQREKVQREIQDLENMLGPHSPIIVSDDDSSCSSDESDLGLSQSVESCLQLNFVYQQVVQESLDKLELLLSTNQKQQEELIAQMSGPFKESSRGQLSSSSYQQPVRMFLGRFLKPYFKDKLTGLGPPANEETKQKALRMAVYLDDRKLKQKRWETWQKTLLIHSVARDGLKRLIQPKLSKVDYLSQKLSGANEADKQSLREQIVSLEDEIEQLRGKQEHELTGLRYEEHDWPKISNIDFEGTKEPEDIRLFWQNYLHPSINKTTWNKEEVQQLKEVSRRHDERHWETIALELGTGRTAFMCLQVFQRFVSQSLKRVSWTPWEDALLRELVNKMRIGNFIPYTQISYFIEGRDPTQLLNRWTLNLDPSLKKGAWTKEEDKLLLQAVSRLGECWWRVRMEVPGRSIMACRERYHDCLKAGVKKGAFTKKERDLLRKLVDKHGVGRWAKIAAEIPNRLDCQCLREWRKMNKSSSQGQRKGKSSSRRGKQKKAGKTKAATRARKGIKKRLVQVKEEELTEEEEDEDFEIPYMDSDEEMEKRESDKEEARVEGQEEIPYIIPPMKGWVPTEKAAPFYHLCSSLVILPPTSDATTGKLTRSTILGQCGRSVIIGPCPKELPWEERHKRNAMMMLSPKQLQVYLIHRGNKLNGQNSRRKRQRKARRKETNQAIDYDLQAAVTPWIGNLLIPMTPRVKAVDILRENAEKRGFSSTSFFMLLLQAENVDVIGCKEIIENRRNKVVIQTPISSPSPVQVPKTVAQALQQRRQMQQQNVEVDKCNMLQNKGFQSPPPPQFSSVQLPTQPHLLLHVPPQTPHAPFSQLVRIRHPVVHKNAPFSFTPFPSTVLPAPKRLSPAGCAEASQVFQSPPVPLLCNIYNFKPNAAAIVQFPPQNPAMFSSLTSTGNQKAQSTPSHVTAAPSSVTNSPAVTKQMEAEPTAAGSSSSAMSLTCVQGMDNSTKHGKKKMDELTQETETSQLSNQTSSNPVTVSNESSAPPPSLATDHNYSHLNQCQTPVPVNQINTSTTKPLNCPVTGKKREREGEETVGDADVGETQKAKRHRRLSVKAKAYQEALQAQIETKTKKLSSRRKKSPSKGKVNNDSSLGVQPAGECSPSTQALWVMTPAGFVQMAQPQALTVFKGPPCFLSPKRSLDSPLPGFVPAHLSTVKPIQCSPSPPLLLNQNSSSLLPSPLRCQGVIKAQSGQASPLRSKGMRFDPSLMFQEPHKNVHDWLSGRGGVAVGRVALPYLPPFVSSLNMMAALLRAKKSLTQSSLDLLHEGPKPRQPPTQSRPDLLSGSTNPPLVVPDFTSDYNGASNSLEHRAAAPTDEQWGEEEELEEEQVRTVRWMVAERFSTNPAYQLLRARFLSCFTLPALLATMPQDKKVEMVQDAEEELRKEVEEQQEKKKKQSVRKRKTQKSRLLSEDADVSANHFSGISSTSKPHPSD